jgi:hypothetical protein
VSHQTETATSTGRKAQVPASPTLPIVLWCSRARKESDDQTSAPPAFRIPSAVEPAVFVAELTNVDGLPAEDAIAPRAARPDGNDDTGAACERGERIVFAGHPRRSDGEARRPKRPSAVGLPGL